MLGPIPDRYVRTCLPDVVLMEMTKQPASEENLSRKVPGRCFLRISSAISLVMANPVIWRGCDASHTSCVCFSAFIVFLNQILNASNLGFATSTPPATTPALAHSHSKSVLSSPLWNLLSSYNAVMNYSTYSEVMTSGSSTGYTGGHSSPSTGISTSTIARGRLMPVLLADKSSLAFQY